MVDPNLNLVQTGGLLLNCEGLRKVYKLNNYVLQKRQKIKEDHKKTPFRVTLIELIDVNYISL